MLEFYSGCTCAVDSRKAVAECLERAVGKKEDPDCDLIIFHTTMGHDFNDLLTEMHKLSPNAQIVGCTCAGVIGEKKVSESMRALAVMAIRGEKDEFAVVGRENITSSNSLECAAGLAQELKNRKPRINMIHFAVSGIDIAADKAIEGIESVFGPDISIFGAASSDNMKAVSNFQFIGEQIFERGAVAVGFADPTLEIITQANHGFVVFGTPFEVTRSVLNRVFEMDGCPAWKCLTDRLGVPETASLADTIPIGAMAEDLPGDLHEEYGNTHILRVIAKKEMDGSIYMPVNCPEGTKLWLTRRDEKRIFDGLDKMLKQIVNRCDGRQPIAVFHADCGARGRLLFNCVLKDEIVSRMQCSLCGNEDVPWLGMYGFGEFAKTGGRNRIYNYTTALHVIVKCNESQ